ncbi:hypothetical protein D3C75_732860 [compost metagenome]
MNITISILPAMPVIPPGIQLWPRNTCVPAAPAPLVPIPIAIQTAMRIKAAMASSLKAARPLSSLLSRSAPNRFNKVTPIIIPDPSSPNGSSGNQLRSRIDTAMASLDIASTRPVQYTQPTVNPAPLPKACSV